MSRINEFFKLYNMYILSPSEDIDFNIHILFLKYPILQYIIMYIINLSPGPGRW